MGDDSRARQCLTAGACIKLLYEACSSLARAKVPAEVATELMGARLTSLAKNQTEV